jgi:hypothetical protein
LCQTKAKAIGWLRSDLHFGLRASQASSDPLLHLGERPAGCEAGRHVLAHEMDECLDRYRLTGCVVEVCWHSCGHDEVRVKAHQRPFKQRQNASSEAGGRVASARIVCPAHLDLAGRDTRVLGANLTMTGSLVVNDGTVTIGGGNLELR